MPSGRANRKPPKKKPSSPEERPKFAPKAFISGTPEQVQGLCNDLAELAAERFGREAQLTFVRYEPQRVTIDTQVNGGKLAIGQDELVNLEHVSA